jgi:hypothetical protein
MREYVVRCLDGRERVLRLTPTDVLTQDVDREVLTVDFADGQQHTIYLRNALDVTFREYQKQVSPKA